jgi:hypothetical protein
VVGIVECWLGIEREIMLKKKVAAVSSRGECDDRI